MNEKLKSPHIQREIISIENKYDITINSEIFTISPLAGEIISYTTLYFILGGITAGFFSEVGKDLWIRVKKLCKDIFKEKVEKKIRPDDIKSQKIVIILEYNSYQVIISSTKLSSFIYDAMMKDFGLDLVDKFWYDFLNEITVVINNIIISNKNIRAISLTHNLSFEMQNISFSWDIEVFSEEKTLEKIKEKYKIH